MFDPGQTVAKLVLDHSECAQVFRRHRIDVCYQGELTLEDAAKERKIAVAVLVGELARAIAERRFERAGDPRELTTPHLVAHIISKHHAYLRKSLPLVRTLAAKVSRVHGDHNPKLRDLAAVVDELVETLVPHLDEEEFSLFPELTDQAPDRRLLTRELATMVDDHLAVEKLLELARAATDDFTVPAWGCTSYRTLFAELEQLEADVFAHVHLENHVLKPRFLST